MKVLDLFSGIGGFSLGLERAGMETVAFCEFDKKAQLVLKKHWPDVPIYDDVRGLNGKQFEGQTIDLICGGFPCQPFSQAGKRKGDQDDRHLWPEYFRLIQEIRPRWVIGENVAGLINMGLDQVLSDLESADYSCQTLVIPACAVNAPHRRDRVWIVAHSDKHSQPNESVNGDKGCGELGCEAEGCCGGAKTIPYSKSTGARDNQRGIRGLSKRCCSWEEGVGQADVAHSKSFDRHEHENVTGDEEIEIQEIPRDRSGSGRNNSRWEVEPDVGRVANGVPNRVDRLKQLGNAVVPQVVEQIGRAIMGIETA